jgi:hypothetical protein
LTEEGCSWAQAGKNSFSRSNSLSGNVLISSDQAHKVERPVKDAFQHGTRKGGLQAQYILGKTLGFWSSRKVIRLNG